MNTVIYARYSSDRQTEQSIEGQLRVCYAHAEHCGYNVVGEYIDRAISGTTDQRPEFQRMIADSAKKQFQYVLVYKLDRFARNRYDSAIYKSRLKKDGVRVISATESIGEGDESILIEALLESMAEMYSRQLSQNTSRGMREMAYKGNFTGGKIPLGYKVVDKKLVINDDEVNVVKLIFNLYADGVSKTKILKELSERGYKQNGGKDYNFNHLTLILKNTRYIGKYNYDGIEIECPRIVSDEVFEKCQRQQAITKRVMGQRPAEDVEYILTGKLFCGKCGTHMIGNSGTGKNGVTHYYYACHKKRKTRDCDKKNERKEELERSIIEHTVLFILQPSFLQFIAENVVKSYYDSFGEREKKALEKELKKINNEIDECFGSLLKTTSKILIEKINEKTESLERQKSEVENELIKLKIASKLTVTEEDVISFLKSFCDGDIEDIEYRKDIVNTLINSIYIYDDKYIIYYNVTGGREEVPYKSNNEILDGDILGLDSCKFGSPYYIWTCHLVDMFNFFMLLSMQRLRNRIYNRNRTDSTGVNR
jgi:Site-specific recombinases, DNA invertase Pin homologs